METTKTQTLSGFADDRGSSLKLLVETAVRKVASERIGNQPRTRQQWIECLADSLMSAAETSHQTVLNAMVASGIPQQEIFQTYVPEVARHIGEMWVSDRASFVDVTVGVGRLQRLYRDHVQTPENVWPARTVPLGRSVLMVIAPFESHSLGAFAAADQMRRHGLWVHMAIGLSPQELVETIRTGPFSMIGLSFSTVDSVEKGTKLIEFVRQNLTDVPPIVVGGRSVELLNGVAKRAGADYAVTSAREAIVKCGLAAVPSSSAALASV